MATKIEIQASEEQKMTTTKNKLEIKNLSVFYGKFRAVTDINMDIQTKKITAIIGPSGCGKSTLLRSFNRMNDLTASARVEGQVLLDGKDINASGVDVVDVRRRIGMVFQRPNPSQKASMTMSPMGHVSMVFAARTIWTRSWKIH